MNMDRRRKSRVSNKENRHSNEKNMDIRAAFKVKKCLFDTPIKLDLQSPLSGPSPKMVTPPDMKLILNDSPFSMFPIKKRTATRSATGKFENFDHETPLKKIDLNKTVEMESPEHSTVAKLNDKKDLSTPTSIAVFSKTQIMCIDSPESSNPVKIAVQKAVMDPNLTGDFSRHCVLPVIEGRHPDLKTLSPQTVADLLRGVKSVNFKLIDCRYPYEYKGGRIKCAENIYHKGEAEDHFFGSSVTSQKIEKLDLLIFYCEYSAERAPSMMRFLRGKDRDLNNDCYPFLFYPELYLIEGGYRAFFSSFVELCEPPEYTMMLDKNSSKEFMHYKALCKDWKKKDKIRKRGRILKL